MKIPSFLFGGFKTFKCLVFFHILIAALSLVDLIVIRLDLNQLKYRTLYRDVYSEKKLTMPLVTNTFLVRVYRQLPTDKIIKLRKLYLIFKII